MQNLERFETLESQVIASLEAAEAHGLASEAGREAFLAAAGALDDLDEVRGSQIYSPLAADPLTRDYVAHLDGQLAGLATRIDILRSHVECGLLTGQGEPAALDQSLSRLLRQLKARFRREAAIVPVYTGWRARHPVVVPMAAPH